MSQAGTGAREDMQGRSRISKALTRPQNGATIKLTEGVAVGRKEVGEENKKRLYDAFLLKVTVVSNL